MDTWFKLCLEVPADLSDTVSGRLFDLGSCGLQVEGGADPLHVCLRAYFPAAAGPDRVAAALWKDLNGLETEVSIRVEGVPQEDWSTAWRKHFRPIFPTPQIAVCPPWEPVPDPEGGFTILVEPKMAFGTGHHETTRLALQMLAQVLRTGDRVLDVGTGSGILSIAAVRLGAGAVTGVDTDPLAVENARENLILNRLEGCVDLYRGSVLEVDGRFDLVVANIISSVLTPMLPALNARLRGSGRSILGGVLDREETTFLGAVEAVGLDVEEVRHDGEWVGVLVVKG